MLILNLFLTLCTLYGTCHYIFVDGSLAVKAIVAFTFVLTGAVNLIYGIIKHKRLEKFPFFTVMGLVFSMAGDIAINYNFIAGAAVFALGHVFYFAAHITLMRFSAKDFIYVLVLFVPSVMFIAFSPIFAFGSGVLFYVCAAYALFISFMTGKSVSNFVRCPSKVTLSAAVGSVLFFFSDLMLVIRFFGGGSELIGFLCLVSYFPAQSLLANAVYGYNKI